jgi:hypothetical protein
MGSIPRRCVRDLMLREIRMNTGPVNLIVRALLVGLLLCPPAFAASLEQEAQQFFSQALASIFSTCGDSSFTKWYPWGFKSPTYIIVQLEGLTTSLEPEPLTASDVREGIDWKGTAVLQSTGRRQYPVDAFTQNSWGEWLKHQPSHPVVVILKQRGQWKLSVPTTFGPYGLTAFERIDCAEVPK